jgi:hypothetical protein
VRPTHDEQQLAGAPKNCSRFQEAHMLESLPELAQRQGMKTGFGGIPQSWLRGAGLAGAVGVAYYVAGRLGVALILKPEGVAVF